MKKTLSVILASLAVSACGSIAIMDKSEAVNAQPEMIITTDAAFWNSAGNYSIAGLYSGEFTRDYSNSTMFNTFSFKDGAMAATIINNESSDTWKILCTGGGLTVTYMGVDFGGNDPYQCEITKDGKEVGEYKIEPEAGMIDMSLEKKEKGLIRIGSTHFNIETIHSSESMMMNVANPLGYSFKQGTQEVAAVQTNGVLTVQMLESLTKEQKDTIAVGAIASALSWRPED